MTLGLRSALGAISSQGVPYNDTGDGITPDNFQAWCCDDPAALTTPSCSAFVQANQSRFAGYRPCSNAAGQGLTFPNLPGPTGPVVPVGGTTPALLTGDPNAILADILKRSAAGDVSQNTAAAAQIVAQLCAEQQVACADNYLLTKVTADCTGCTFDFGKPGIWLAIGLAALLALILVRKL